MTDETPVRQLIRALRSPLPTGFEWDFQSDDKCALGLAVRMGLLSYDEFALSRVSAIFEIQIRAWRNPFSAQELNGVVPLYGVAARDVIPAMVAEVLENLIGREG